MKKVSEKMSRKLVVIILAIISIFLLTSASLLIVIKYKNANSNSKPAIDLVATIDVDDKNDFTQLDDFNVNGSGYTLLTNDGISYIDNGGKVLWNKKSAQDRPYEKIVSTENNIFAILHVLPRETNSSSNGHYLLQKLDLKGAELWRFELPPMHLLKSTGQLIVSMNDEIDINGEFVGSIAIGENIVNSEGLTDILKIKIDAGNSPKIISYAQIGSGGADSIRSNSNHYNDEDLLELGGPILATSSYPYYEKQTIETKQGTYYCNCTGISDAQKAYPIIAIEPTLFDNAYWISTTQKTDKDKNYTSTDYLYTLYSTEPINGTYQALKGAKDVNNTSAYYINRKSRLYGYPTAVTRNINNDFIEDSVDSNDKQLIKPYSLSTTKDNIAVVGIGEVHGVNIVGGPVIKLNIYDKDLKNYSSIDIDGLALTTNSLQAYGRKFYVLVYGKSKNNVHDSVAKIYKVNIN